MRGARIEVTGIVQGVGFRPFVYRLAKKTGITGYVKNMGNSVEILAVGGGEEINDFLAGLERDAPPLARIDNVSVQPTDEKDLQAFKIVESSSAGGSGSVLPPDVCICETCLAEINDPSNPRYGYPFTVCVDCGARYTIIETVPYDRVNTSMTDFPMCSECKREYEDPVDRRFHAEPTCCPACGPSYHLYYGSKLVDVINPVEAAVGKLDEGRIVAVMGVGGTHLASALDDTVVQRLRRRFNRPEKPFAIMVRGLEAASKFASLSEIEKRLLTSLRRPIVAVQKKSVAPELVAPGLDNIGIMLPYTALHHMMFNYTDADGFVMTSANLPGEPMFTEAEEVVASSFSDYCLVHNRQILNRVDDSVIRVVGDRPAFIRRSRGYVPEPIQLEKESGEVVLGLGAELNVTGCLLKGDRAFLTQYIGDTTKLRTLEFLESAVNRLLKLTGTKSVDRIVIDMHPGYATRALGRKLADRFGTPLSEVQHHYAHASSLMAENRLDEVVCLSLDGAGYGLDGSVWGGEVICVDEGGMTRSASLEPQPMPGGDLAAVYPARMLAGILHSHYSEEELKSVLARHRGDAFRDGELDLVLKQLRSGFNTPFTSSTGRVLDAAAALLGVCWERTYEGEPAMKLEALADKGKPVFELPIRFSKHQGREIFETGKMLKESVEFLESDCKKADIAASIQNTLARGLAILAVKCGRQNRVKAIGVSGGVAYNNAIVTEIERHVKSEGFEFYTQTQAPPGDGGISLGQVWHTIKKGR
ncbi:carbamoyltransferase HypF [archaeon BMS3Abin16]|nr:carbamoyltransferase HypF [archaeon BMS3Abin16]